MIWKSAVLKNFRKNKSLKTFLKNLAAENKKEKNFFPEIKELREEEKH